MVAFPLTLSHCLEETSCPHQLIPKLQRRVGMWPCGNLAGARLAGDDGALLSIILGVAAFRELSRKSDMLAMRLVYSKGLA